MDRFWKESIKARSTGQSFLLTCQGKYIQLDVFFDNYKESTFSWARFH